VGPFLHDSLGFPEHYLPYIGVVLVLAVGKWLVTLSEKRHSPSV